MRGGKMNNVNTIATVYCERDYEKIKIVIDQIQEKGYDVWHYCNQIFGYASLNEIAVEILQSNLLIAFISPLFSFSSWQKKAIDLGKMNGKILILVFLDGFSFFDMPKNLQSFYSDSINVTYSSDGKETVESLCELLEIYMPLEEIAVSEKNF